METCKQTATRNQPLSRTHSQPHRHNRSHSKRLLLTYFAHKFPGCMAANRLQRPITTKASTTAPTRRIFSLMPNNGSNTTVPGRIITKNIITRITRSKSKPPNQLNLKPSKKPTGISRIKPTSNEPPQSSTATKHLASFAITYSVKSKHLPKRHGKAAILFPSPLGSSLF